MFEHPGIEKPNTIHIFPSALCFVLFIPLCLTILPVYPKPNLISFILFCKIGFKAFILTDGEYIDVTLYTTLCVICKYLNTTAQQRFEPAFL
jgi:hypothetical protein